MGIGAECFLALRYDGAGGCSHDVLLRAGRPSYPNADQGAEDAADAFVDSALAHLRRWWEQWRLPSLCPGAHSLTHVARGETLVAGDDCDELTGPGFRWVDAWLAVDPQGALIVGSAPDEASFWRLVNEAPDVARRPAQAERVQAYLLTDAGADGDLRDG